MKKAINQDKIPKTHKCKGCSKTKKEAKFRVTENKLKDGTKKFYIASRCYICEYIKYMERRNIPKVKKVPIREQIDQYFKDKEK